MEKKIARSLSRQRIVWEQYCGILNLSIVLSLVPCFIIIIKLFDLIFTSLFVFTISVVRKGANNLFELFKVIFWLKKRSIMLLMQIITPCPGPWYLQSRIVSVYCCYKVMTKSIDAVDARSRAECESGFFGRIVFGSSDFHAYRCC